MSEEQAPQAPQAPQASQAPQAPAQASEALKKKEYLALKRLGTARRALMKSMRKKKILANFTKQFSSFLKVAVMPTDREKAVVEEMKELHEAMVRRKQGNVIRLDQFQFLMSKKMRLLNIRKIKTGKVSDGKSYQTEVLPVRAKDRVIGHFYIYCGVLVKWDGYNLCCVHDIQLRSCEQCRVCEHKKRKSKCMICLSEKNKLKELYN